ncbi:MAG: hypothetical protein ACPGSC_15275 [Granulosicoccaceae bacterium]
MNFSPRDGALNLLTEAVKLQAGQRIAIVSEDPALGTYDALAPRCVLETARDLGAQAQLIPVQGAEATHLSLELAQALETFDHVLFMASIGDTLRFSPQQNHAKRTMCYALDIGTLGSAGATVSFQLMREIQKRFEQESGTAQTWHIQCPLGTDLCGTQDVAAIQAGTAPDFSMTRFPVCAPRPTLCSDAEGVVALSHWLLPTGNGNYDDATLDLNAPIFAVIKRGRIVDFQGDKKTARAATRHYQRVASLFNIDPWAVHSWHAGMNPGISYPVSAHGDPSRWGKTAFANPRYLHFHTCGDYAPGEICWSVFDATVTMDQQVYWQDGYFCFLDRADIRELLAKHNYPDGLEVRRDIGVPLPQLLRAQ